MAAPPTVGTAAVSSVTASPSVVVPAPSSPTLTLPAAASAYVQGGAYANENFGTTTQILVKANASADVTRLGLIKFNLSGMPAGLSSVQLRLFGHLNSSSSTNVTTDLYAATDTTWTESGPGGVTWNTLPAYASVPLASVTVANTSGAWYSFDVTSYVQAQKAAGRNVVAFVLENPNPTDAVTSFSSNQASSNQPQLLIVPTGAAAVATSSTSIQVSWTDNSAKQASYRVERSSDGVNYALVGTTGPGQTSFTDASGLLEGETYFYRVQAVYNGALSDYLAGAAAATLPAAPTAPKLAQSSGQVSLAWANDSRGALGYVVERSVDGLSWSVIANLDGAATLSYTDAAPAEGPLYYRVRATDSGGVSKASSSTSIVYAYPLSPTGLTCAFPSGTEIDLSWTNHSASETGFEIERSPDGQSGWTQIGTTGPGVTQFADTGRLPYAAYYYRVEACNAAGESPSTPTLLADRLAPLQSETLSSLASLDAALLQAQPNLTIRQLTEGAYYALALGVPNAAAKAESYLTLALDKQLPDGNFGWNWADTTNTDPNSVEFTMLPVAIVFLRYGNLLSDSFKDYALPHLQNAITAIENQQVSVDYTNIYTMKFVNLLLLGQVAGDPAAQAAGAADLTAWMSEIGASGIHEYDSPTYEAVTYGNLLAGYNNTNNSAARGQVQTALDYLAADMAANYFGGRSNQNLAGAYSRDYDVPGTTSSAVDQIYYIEGLSAVPPAGSAPSGSSFSPGIPVYLNALEGGYHPPADVLALASPADRVIQQEWGSTAGQDRYTYITPDFAVGSSSGYYGPQDKQIAVELASSKVLPQISLVQDQFDSPYGGVLTPDPSGESKPTHLQDAIAAVQQQGTILALSNLGPQFSGSPSQTYTSIASNLLFPAQADDLYLNGVEITNRTAAITTSVGAVLGIRVGNSVVAVRFFQADGLAGYSPTCMIKFDGGASGAARFVVYDYSGPARAFAANTTCRVGVLVAVQQCTTDAAAAAFLQSFQNAPVTLNTAGSQTSASVTLGNVTLAAALDTAKNTIVYRRVNGADYQPQLFSFSDGTTTRNIAAEILGAASEGAMAAAAAYGAQTNTAAASDAVFQQSTSNQWLQYF
jgi:hypothetical protein